MAYRLERLGTVQRLLALAAFCLLLSGCATYEWYRANTPPDVVAQEQADCYALARDAARDIAVSAFPRLYGPGPWPYAGWGVWGDPYWGWGPMSDPLWQLDAQQTIHDRCMRGRGYELRRVPKDSRVSAAPPARQ